MVCFLFASSPKQRATHGCLPLYYSRWWFRRTQETSYLHLKGAPMSVIGPIPHGSHFLWWPLSVLNVSKSAHTLDCLKLTCLSLCYIVQRPSHEASRWKFVTTSVLLLLCRTLVFVSFESLYHLKMNSWLHLWNLPPLGGSKALASACSSRGKITSLWSGAEWFSLGLLLLICLVLFSAGKRRMSTLEQVSASNSLTYGQGGNKG